jgi:superfamily I DNA and RNA helicase
MQKVDIGHKVKTHSLKHAYTTHARRKEDVKRTKLRTGHKSTKVAKMYDHYTMEDEVELVERLKFSVLDKYLDVPSADPTMALPKKRKGSSSCVNPVKYSRS